jgi:hypothetical protein
MNDDYCFVKVLHFKQRKVVIMAKFKGAVLSCKGCHSSFRVPPSRADKAEYCSIGCASIARGKKFSKEKIALNCKNCQKAFECFPAHANRRIYCSYECKYHASEYKAKKSTLFMGDKNPSWKGGRTEHSDGYIYVYVPEHPFSSNGYVFEHRLIMEKWLRDNEPESQYLVKLGQQLYLSPKFVVHHHDEDKTNNAIKNLQCMTNSEHQIHHAAARKVAHT